MSKKLNLHIELTKFGLYVYVDDKKRGTKVSYNELANECNLIDEDDVKTLVNGFNTKGKVFMIELDQFITDAKADFPITTKLRTKHGLISKRKK